MDYSQLKVSDETGEAVVANIESDRSAAATTLDVDSVDNWPQKFIFATGTTDSDGFITAASMTVMYGHLDSGNIIIDGFAPGYTDAGNTSGQVAIIKPNTFWTDEIVSLAKAAHRDDGQPNFTNVYDENDNESLELGFVALAVNHVKMTNAATDDAPVIEAVGDDTDVDLRIKAKGAGTVQPGTPVAFRATVTGTTGNIVYTGSSITATEDFDLGSNFAGSTFTAPYDGVYHFEVVGSINNHSARFVTKITAGGSTAAAGFADAGSTNRDPHISASATVKLNAGDTVTVDFGSETSGQSLVAPSYFSGHLIGRTD